MNAPASSPRLAPFEATVDVQNLRRDLLVARARLLLSVAALFAAPWAVGTVAGGVLGLGAFLIAAGFYLWSAQALAGTDRGAGERAFVEGRIAVEGGDLVASMGASTKRLPLSRVSGGWIERTAAAHAAVLTFSDGHVAAVEAATEDEAAALLRALGAGAEARAMRMRGYRESTGGRKIAGCLLAFFAPVLVPPMVAIPVLLVTAASGGRNLWGAALAVAAGSAPLFALGYWLWAKVRPTWLHIGADGIVVPGLLRERFVPHGDITGAAHTTGGIENAYHFVRISLAGSQRPITLPAANPGEADAIVERIRGAGEAMKAQERARLLDALSRADRPVPEWRRALGALLARGDYRSAGRDVEEVMRIVEDPAAPLEQRVAAALAVRPHEDEAIQERIRVAAGACVEPRVRIVLEKAAAGDIEDAELSAIEGEGAPAAPRRAREPGG